MAWAYILQCADGSFYVGSTVDLDGRVSQHNAGLERRTPDVAADSR
jgi:putative endonuclease